MFLTRTVTVNGKMVSFIETWCRFSTLNLTGRENVYMNGAMLGFTTAEVDAMYDEIVEFAELEDFMNQKLKNYSSGMQVRLAFSVAIKAQGDVLILDEVLAVGDEAFQRKCNDYFMERKKSGKTTILVTHDMGAVKKYCNKAILIEDGYIKAKGEPRDVANQYSFDNTEQVITSEQSGIERSGSLVENLKLSLLSSKRATPNEPISFDLTYTLLEDVPTYIAISFTDIDRNIWIYNDNALDYPTQGSGHKSYRYSCSIASLNDIKLKLQVTILGKSKEMLAFANNNNAPIIVLNRDDINLDDLSAMDSASGIVKRNGNWEILSD